MTSLDIVGGVYREICLANEWNQIFGSGGRAAAAVTKHVDQVNLWTHIQKDLAWTFEAYASTYGFALLASDAPQVITFSYVHSLSEVALSPSKEFIKRLAPITVECGAILRFGMIEASGIVHAERCVYDPQSEFDPEPFDANGSTAEELAIVGNEAEIRLLGNDSAAIDAAKNLISQGCGVVVVKAGPEGAFVVTADDVKVIPAYRTNFVWTLGTGDVFAAIFAAQWAANKTDAIFAAEAASRAVAEYVESADVVIPPLAKLFAKDRPVVKRVPGKVYLAGPFFNLQQRWLLEESLRCLRGFGMDVFSPLHEVGVGGDEVAWPDLKGLEECDRVLALVDGLDSGTLFELGFATKMKRPIYAFSQSSTEQDLVMLRGTGSHIIQDFVTAIHWTVWRV